MQNDVVLVSDNPKRHRFMLYLKKKKNNKRRRFLSYRDETTSFRQSHVPKRGTLVPGRAEMQIARGCVCVCVCVGGGGGGGGGGEKEEVKND